MLCSHSQDPDQDSLLVDGECTSNMSGSGIEDEDGGDAAIFTQTNIAVWVLTMSSGAFLAVRLWCRHRFSKLWWDDALLTFSWVRYRASTPTTPPGTDLDRSSCLSRPRC